MSVIVCSYGEIHLKGANRGYFLRTLMQNIRQVLPQNVKPFTEKLTSRPRSCFATSNDTS